MSIKKKEPKCMDINNYFQLNRITKTMVSNKINYYCIEYDGEATGEEFKTEKEVNEYLKKLKKNNIMKLQYINIVKKNYIWTSDILQNCKTHMYGENTHIIPYVKDIIKYIQLFLFRKIKVMSIVKLIMNGKYFIDMENDFYPKSLDYLFSVLYTDHYYGNYDSSEEEEQERVNDLKRYYKNFDAYKPIKGMCSNFNKLQYIQ